MKHRVIMDLTANLVDDAVSMPERQVLPTCVSHTVVMPVLVNKLADVNVDPGANLYYFVLDVADAFMGGPLADE